MNLTKINQEAVKNIINGGKFGFNVLGYWDGEYLIITFDGYAYFLKDKDIAFDKSCVKEMGKAFPDIQTINLPENEIHITKSYVESGFSSKSLLRVFKGSRALDEKNKKEWKVYIDAKIMKPLEKEDSIISFYQAYDEKADMSTKPIFAFLPSGTALMAMLPVRVFDDDEFE